MNQPQLLELPGGRHGGAGIPLGLSQRKLWMCRAELVLTPLVLWPSWLSWIPLPLKILLISRGFLLKAVGAELLPVEVVVVATKPELGSEPDSEADFQKL